MTRGLVLIDLQHDFLAAPGLEPAAGELIERASRLLAAWRAIGGVVAHVHTRVPPDGAGALPHWRVAGQLRCVRGTAGAEPPPALAPRSGEITAEKTFYSGFDDPHLEPSLRALGVSTIVMAGLHLHACVRETAIAAWRLGLEVTIAEDVVGSDEPLHAAAVRRWLATRGIRFAPATELLDRLAAGAEATGAPRGNTPGTSPHGTRTAGASAAATAAALGPPALPEVPVTAGAGAPAAERLPLDLGQTPVSAAPWPPAADGAGEIRRLCAAARAAAPAWAARPQAERAALVTVAADLLAARAAAFATQIAREVAKPLRDAAAEVDRSVALLRAAAGAPAPADLAHGPGARSRRIPHGVVALVTPWNNPVGIPLGKLGPALVYGNCVIWKPSPLAPGTARMVADLLHAAGVPAGALGLALGGDEAARRLLDDPDVDAASLSGSSAAGTAAQEICARRRIPLQAELGGNNGAIVWGDADLAAAAEAVARGAFSFAGQRCTANRRVVIEASALETFVQELAAATGRLRFGDPLDPATDLGPLVSSTAAARVAALVARAAPACRIAATPLGPPLARGAWLAPAIVVASEPAAEIVQEETFGPVLVVQPAADFEHALALLDGVRQGLIAALFSPGRERRARFLAAARAGVLKLDRSTVDAAVEAPFGGFKASGLGPPEHGPGNLEFYTRIQAVYGPETP
ncbi:MAG TPA: aldehyde dehydrogenase family protein [Thermoanaerobaculia bacterium]|nr:aldehyde dehydrogenase family protein [Thermoanaerobaculia bacterium]